MLIVYYYYRYLILQNTFYFHSFINTHIRHLIMCQTKKKAISIKHIIRWAMMYKPYAITVNVFEGYSKIIAIIKT